MFTITPASKMPFTSYSRTRFQHSLTLKTGSSSPVAPATIGQTTDATELM